MKRGVKGHKSDRCREKHYDASSRCCFSFRAFQVNKLVGRNQSVHKREKSYPDAEDADDSIVKELFESLDVNQLRLIWVGLIF